MTDNKHMTKNESVTLIMQLTHSTAKSQCIWVRSYVNRQCWGPSLVPQIHMCAWWCAWWLTHTYFTWVNYTDTGFVMQISYIDTWNISHHLLWVYTPPAVSLWVWWMMFHLSYLYRYMVFHACQLNTDAQYFTSHRWMIFTHVNYTDRWYFTLVNYADAWYFHTHLLHRCKVFDSNYVDIRYFTLVSYTDAWCVAIMSQLHRCMRLYASQLQRHRTFHTSQLHRCRIFHGTSQLHRQIFHTSQLHWHMLWIHTTTKTDGTLCQSFTQTLAISSIWKKEEMQLVTQQPYTHEVGLQRLDQ